MKNLKIKLIILNFKNVSLIFILAFLLPLVANTTVFAIQPDYVRNLYDYKIPVHGYIKSSHVNINRFPIIMYHTSSENHPGKLTDLFVKPSEFEKQMQLVANQGYTAVTFADFPLKNISKPIMITFDDGYKTNYTEIYPIIKKLHIKMTIFLTTAPIDQLDRLSKAQIKEMSNSGLVSFQSHTVTHRSLKTLSHKELDVELINSKIIIENLTGKKVTAIAYPNGEYSKSIIPNITKYYKYGLRKNGGMHTIQDPNYELKRIRISRKTRIGNFARTIGR